LGGADASGVDEFGFGLDAGCDRVAEEGWAGVSDVGEPDAAGADAEGVGEVGLGRVEEGDILSLRLRLRSGFRQSGRGFIPAFFWPA
jgi:hypothetical protein